MREGGSGPAHHDVFHITNHPQCPTKPSLCQPQPVGDKNYTLNTVLGGVTLEPVVPVGTRLGVRASLRVCRDRRAGQSSGEEQGRKQGMSVIGLRGVEGKRLGREALAVTGCGHGARPPACHPRFPHGEGRKLPIPGSLVGGGTGCGAS